ncbi:uncharacterized protein LOC105214497 isoform X3 [Zeugodacus cucurbitae]|uniref:uncharacterized protein LOC105214497 isoform X3 n=1 Tax=Zeugodacus cucurbitae TaxID=28588 RepID=UPI0023D915A3|nr:uncharacterized protein LOC105214497 isoform X3 [Zeugodacus cucurbitae]
MTLVFNKIMWLCLLVVAVKTRFVVAYDPNDTKIASVIPPEGFFEAFYPREMDGVPNSASRPAHAHGSFFKHRNPALVDTKNAAAYGYRFDAKYSPLYTIDI